MNCAQRAKKPLDLDDVLIHELGQFGRFQLTSLLLVSVPIMLSAFKSEYIFSAAAIPHRCSIAECGEKNRDLSYHQPWTKHAVPAVTNIVTGVVEGLASCERFAPTGGRGSLSYCPSSLFNRSKTIPCEGYVYARNNSVVYEFDLGCQDWMRALAGTLNSLGTLLVLPITGYVSDHYGRRIALIINVFNLGLIGFIRAFSVNYAMYLTLQALQTTLGAGTYSTAYIFATELVGLKYRVITSATCSSMFAVGQVILGLVAWLVQPWRQMIMILYVPCFFIVGYYWILTESVRWLLCKRKFEEAREVLEQVARANKREISSYTLHALSCPPELVEQEKPEEESVFMAILKSRILLKRLCTTPIWWITTTFVYYGLSINSTSLSDTMYLNFILTCSIEIPAYYSAVLMLDRLGRRATLFCSFFLSGACNIAFPFIKKDLFIARLCTDLFGKFGISVVFSSVYLYTSELYPTQYRHTLLGFSSMIGRIGSFTAPLTPVLTQYWSGIPSLMFGVMTLVSALLALSQPETLGTKMPDTIAEAEALGRPEHNSSRS